MIEQLDSSLGTPNLLDLHMNGIEFEPVLFSRASEYIERNIAESILAGKLKAGDRLPTEKEMARKFGVSLVTLREALRALERSLGRRKKGLFAPKGPSRKRGTKGGAET